MDWQTNFGPPTWRLLHCLAAKFPKKEMLGRAVYGIISGIPCLSCRHHALDAWSKKRPDCGVEYFLFDFHNLVNVKLGKPALPIGRLATYYISENSSTILTRDLFLVYLVSVGDREGWLGTILHHIFGHDQRVQYIKYKNSQDLTYLQTIKMN